ncbi:MAG: hypothetical protein ACHQIM_15825 [Sphingobacteriales bacterium]
MNKPFLLKAIFLLLLITSHFCLKAQNLEEDTVKRDSTIRSADRARSVFIEVGGAGLALTLNYDSRFGQTRDKWGYRAGAGYYNTGANSVFSVPFQVNYLYNIGHSTSSFIEAGAGTTFLISRGSTNGTYFQFDNITGFCGTVSLGYRYQQENGGINFRIVFDPIIYDQGLLYEGGISIGYTF